MQENNQVQENPAQSNGYYTLSPELLLKIYQYMEDPRLMSPAMRSQLPQDDSKFRALIHAFIKIRGDGINGLNDQELSILSDFGISFRNVTIYSQGFRPAERNTVDKNALLYNPPITGATLYFGRGIDTRSRRERSYHDDAGYRRIVAGKFKSFYLSAITEAIRKGETDIECTFCPIGGGVFAGNVDQIQRASFEALESIRDAVPDSLKLNVTFKDFSGHYPEATISTIKENIIYTQVQGTEGTRDATCRRPGDSQYLFVPGNYVLGNGYDTEPCNKINGTSEGALFSATDIGFVMHDVPRKSDDRMDPDTGASSTERRSPKDLFRARNAMEGKPGKTYGQFLIETLEYVSLHCPATELLPPEQAAKLAEFFQKYGSPEESLLPGGQQAVRPPQQPERGSSASARNEPARNEPPVSRASAAEKDYSVLYGAMAIVLLVGIAAAAVGAWVSNAIIIGVGVGIAIGGIAWCLKHYLTSQQAIEEPEEELQMRRDEQIEVR